MCPSPWPPPGEVLVKLTSTSINPIDYKIRRGDMKDIMPLQLPTIPGYDLAGQIVALGEGVTGIELDTLVMGVTDHTYAEYVTCKAEDPGADAGRPQPRRCRRVPPGAADRRAIDRKGNRPEIRTEATGDRCLGQRGADRGPRSQTARSLRDRRRARESARRGSRAER